MDNSIRQLPLIPVEDTPSKAPTLPVIEIFGPTVQGEGRMVGTPVHFLRLGGCDYRCSWCDSLFAVLPSEVRKNAAHLTAEQILSAIQGLEGDPGWVVISGGNPAIQKLGPLISLLHQNDYRVAIETQGSRMPEWIWDVDLLTISPKPPSSGMETSWSTLTKLVEEAHSRKIPTDIKVVAFDDQDLEYAKRVFTNYPQQRDDLRRHFISLGTFVGESTRDDLLDRLADQVERCTRDPILARVTNLCQLHVLIWGHRRGV
jgi:7-carboxy-7-deazaguanine synthase